MLRKPDVAVPDPFTKFNCVLNTSRGECRYVLPLFLMPIEHRIDRGPSNRVCRFNSRRRQVHQMFFPALKSVYPMSRCRNILSGVYETGKKKECEVGVIECKVRIVNFLYVDLSVKGCRIVFEISHQEPSPATASVKTRLNSGSSETRGTSP